MKKMRGFTLIELFITIVVIVIFSIMCLAIWSGTNPGNGVSMGYNGLVETRCVNGFKFMVGSRGYVTQVLDENGHGVRCAE